MKHLQPYKLFESVSDIRNEIEDILTEIYHLGFEISFYNTAHSHFNEIKVFIEKPNDDLESYLSSSDNFKPTQEFVDSLQHLISWADENKFVYSIESKKNGSLFKQYKSVEDIESITQDDINYITIIFRLSKFGSQTFEKLSSVDLELDVSDMFLELEEDYGYSVGVSMRPSGVNMFCVEASRDDLFQWSDVKDYFERAKEHIEDNGWVLTKSVLCYYPQSAFNDKVKVLNRIKTKEFSGSNWNYFRTFITEPEFIENNMINEIALIFDPKK